MAKNAAPDMPEEKASGTTHNPPATEKKERVKLWLVVRIVDYRLQALSAEDAELPMADQEWSEIGGHTTISKDREAMYQLARANQGLLMAATGLPSPGRMASFSAALKAAEAPEPF